METPSPSISPDNLLRNVLVRFSRDRMFATGEIRYPKRSVRILSRRSSFPHCELRCPQVVSKDAGKRNTRSPSHREELRMTEMLWIRPRTLSEALDYLKDESLHVHGGGTHLLRNWKGSIRGLIDLSELGLDFVRISKEWIDIGAMATYADVVRALKNSFPENVLVDALSGTASTALRNRITIGGSFALLPPWSNVLGPAIATDAIVSIEGLNRGLHPVADVRRNKLLLKGSLIHSVRIPVRHSLAVFHTEKRVAFDYPSFTITICADFERDLFANVRIVITGVTDLFARLESIERKIEGRSPAEVDSRAVCASLPISFTMKPLGSPQYLLELATVQLERCVMKLVSLASRKRG